MEGFSKTNIKISNTKMAGLHKDTSELQIRDTEPAAFTSLLEYIYLPQVLDTILKTNSDLKRHTLEPKIPRCFILVLSYFPMENYWFKISP